MVLSFSSVACLRARSEELVACVLSTLLNITLYRSILMLGISMLRRGPEPRADDEGTGGLELDDW